MEGYCSQIIYSFLAQCLINTGDMDFCGPRVEDFRPIYSLVKCEACEPLPKDLFVSHNQCVIRKDNK